MTIPEVVEQQDSCQGKGCGKLAAAWCWAWDQFLCEQCRYIRTMRELADGGRHPASAGCSCAPCRTHRALGGSRPERGLRLWAVLTSWLVP